MLPFPQPIWYYTLAQPIPLSSLLIIHPLCPVSPNPVTPPFLLSLQIVSLSLSTDYISCLDLESSRRHSSGHSSEDATREVPLSREHLSWMWVAPFHRLKIQDWIKKRTRWKRAEHISRHFLSVHKLTSCLTLFLTSNRPFLPSLSCFCGVFCQHD